MLTSTVKLVYSGIHTELIVAFIESTYIKWTYEVDITTSSTVKPTRCISVSNLFYFGMTLYMFRTVFLSIIRSS